MASTEQEKSLLMSYRGMMEDVISGNPSPFLQGNGVDPELTRLADSARNGTLPNAPSPMGDSVYIQALDAGASPRQALEAAMSATQAAVTQQLQREALTKAKAQAPNVAARAVISQNPGVLFGGAPGGTEASAVASAFGVSPRALGDALAEEVPPPSPPVEINRGTTPGGRGPLTTFIDNTLAGDHGSHRTGIPLGDPGSEQFHPELIAQMMKEATPPPTDNLVDIMRGVASQAPIPGGPWAGEQALIEEISSQPTSIRQQEWLNQPGWVKRPEGRDPTKEAWDLAANITPRPGTYGDRPPTSIRQQEWLNELAMTDAKALAEATTPADEDFTGTDLSQYTLHPSAERPVTTAVVPTGTGGPAVVETGPRGGLDPTAIEEQRIEDTQPVEAYIWGEVKAPIYGVHGLPFDQQYELMSQKALGNRWYNSSVQQYARAQRDVVFGRFVLQKLMASFDGAVYGPTAGDLKRGSIGTEGQEYYADFVFRGYTQQGWSDPAVMQSSWDNLVLASDPSYTATDSLRRRYAQVAGSYEYQVVAAKAKAGLNGYGPMGQMRLNAFQRLLDEFNQAVHLGGETRGLAAFLADIKGSVWELGYTKPGTQALPVSKERAVAPLYPLGEEV